MQNTATHRPHSTTGRRRVPAVIAMAMAAGVVLGACSADPETEPAPAPATKSATSSSSSSVPSPTTPEVAEQVSDPPAPAAPAPVAPQPTPQLPANVVGTRGPCHMLGEVAQAEDGSALFCTQSPGDAGPLWMPSAPGGGDGGAGDGAAGGAIGQAFPGGPCSQEGLAVAGPGGTVLTCSLTGGGDVPGGLYWK